MKQRPEHAADCPGCDTGWVFGDLLCPRCTNNVNTAQPDYYPSWLSARAELYSTHPTVPSGPEGWAAIEAYRRGLIVGTARAMHTPPNSNRRDWHYVITPAGHRALDAATKKDTPP